MVGKRWERLAPELCPDAEGGLSKSTSNGEKQEWRCPSWADCGDGADDTQGGTKEPCSPKEMVEVGGRFCGEGSANVHVGMRSPPIAQGVLEEQHELAEIAAAGAAAPSVRAGGDSSSEGRAC